MTQLGEMIEEQKQESFSDPSKHTDEEALGILIAHHFEWDGLAILRTFFNALEDANFHTEAAKVHEMIAAEEAA